MPIVINIGRRAERPPAASPEIVALVGTSIQDTGESAPDYGVYQDISSVADAERIFGTGQAGGRDGSIVEAVKIIDAFRLPPIKAAAVDVSTGLDQANVRAAINTVVDAAPTEATFFAAPGLTANFDASDDPLTTVCSTVARLNARAAAGRGIAFIDTAWDSVADAITYLGVAGNVAPRVLPMALRLIGATDSVAHPSSAFAIGAILDWVSSRGAQANWSGVPVHGVTRQEHEALRTPGDPNSAVQRIRNAGGSVVAWSGSQWKLYGGILGGAGNAAIERFASVRRVEDILIDRIFEAYEPYEEDNLTVDTLPTLLAVGERMLRAQRAAGLIAGFDLASDAAYNTPDNLRAANVGIALDIDVFTPAGTIRVTVNFNQFAPTGIQAAA